MRTLLFLTALLAFTNSQAYTGLDIMKLNDAQRRVNDEQVELQMILKNPQGQERIRELQVVTKTVEKDIQNSILKFKAPRNIAGTGLLTLENKDTDDDQWLYLPTLKKSRRISAADQTDSFMGTDFTYEDLNPENIEDFNYQILGNEKLTDMDCYKIEATPANESIKNKSGYSKRIIWIRQDSNLAERIDFIDKQGKESKRLLAKDFITASENVYRAKSIVMQNLQTGHSTSLIYNNFVINQGIKNTLFTMRNLEQN